MSASLVSRVVRALRDDRLAAAGDRVLAAVSGGPDSVALAWILREALPRVGARLTGLAHLNHRLRGPESDADELFCREVASTLGLPIHVERCDIRRLVRARRRSVEAVAHDERLAFFERARVALVATLVATGHTRNDQAETVLLHLVRGAGLTGLAGMRPSNGIMIRPMLGLGRGEIEAFLRGRAIAFRQDASNSELAIPRNRIRHEVLPLLRERCSPRAVEAISRAARLAAADDGLLDSLATGAGAGIVERTGDACRIDLCGLAGLPLSLQRRVLRRALLELPGGRAVTANHVDRVLSLAAASKASGMRLALPGIVVSRQAGVLVAGARREEPRAESTARHLQSRGIAVPRPLPVPGAVEDPAGGWVVRVTAAVSGSHADPTRGSPGGATVDAAAVGGTLFVRTRRPGDRFRPLGLGGRKKLQDLFVDRKVAREERDRVPLVVDANDRIVWVAGHAIAEEFRVTPATTGVLLFELSPCRRLV